MATGSERATFSVDVESDSSDVEQTSRAVEALRERIQGGEQAAKDMSATLRRLKGNSDEVKKAKEELTAKIKAERDAVSAAQLRLAKAGVSYDALTRKTRELAQQQKELAAKSTASVTAAVKSAGGPVATLRDRLEQLKSVAGGAGGKLGLLTLAAAGTVAILAALVVGAGVAVIALGKFILESGNAARSAQLLREATTGSAENAANLGSQVDALARKIPTSKDAINELAVSLARNRISGEAVVDTMNLVGQASAAMGDEVGNRLKDLVTRSQLYGRMFVQPLELLGTGLHFDDVAGELATSMMTSLANARTALLQGRVKLEDGAKALRGAVEKRFAEVNARKLLDLNVQAQKFREKLVSLTANVKLEPLLKALDRMLSLFDESTVTGSALKQLVTVVGNGLTGALEKGTPIAKAFLQGLVIGALQAGIIFFRLRRQLRETFGGSDVLKGINLTKAALAAGMFVVGSFAMSVGITAAVVIGLGVALAGLSKPFVALYDAVKSAITAITKGDWSGLGKAVIDGLRAGLGAGLGPVGGAVGALADRVSGAFKRKLKIGSPSKLFREYGEYTAEGYAEGVDRGTPHAAAAIEAMAAPPAAGGGTRGGGPITVNVTINAGGASAEAVAQLSEPPFLGNLTKAILDALVAAGIPVPA